MSLFSLLYNTYFQNLCVKHSPFTITNRMVCTFKGPSGRETTCQVTHRRTKFKNIINCLKILPLYNFCSKRLQLSGDITARANYYFRATVAVLWW